MSKLYSKILLFFSRELEPTRHYHVDGGKVISVFASKVSYQVVNIYLMCDSVGINCNITLDFGKIF